MATHVKLCGCPSQRHPPSDLRGMATPAAAAALWSAAAAAAVGEPPAAGLASTATAAGSPRLGSRHDPPRPLASLQRRPCPLVHRSRCSPACCRRSCRQGCSACCCRAAADLPPRRGSRHVAQDSAIVSLVKLQGPRMKLETQTMQNVVGGSRQTRRLGRLPPQTALLSPGAIVLDRPEGRTASASRLSASAAAAAAVAGGGGRETADVVP